MAGITTTNRARLGVEGLERREVPSVTSAALVGTTLTVRTDGAPTRVELIRVGGQVWVRDVSAARPGAGGLFPAAAVARVDVRTGGGNDRVDASRLGATPVTADLGFGDDTALGGAGDDTLRGSFGSDSLDGGAGNDSLDGGFGHDSLAGSSGDDALRGSFGNDRLDGGAGADDLDGSFGNDLLVALDGAHADTLRGGAGADDLRIDFSAVAVTRYRDVLVYSPSTGPRVERIPYTVEEVRSDVIASGDESDRVMYG
ncbi:MAG: hypothetical protein K2X82_10960 [Gemmataceae bacterium]|nr:hypothetical protein [Gemmataceae bacterium]